MPPGRARWVLAVLGLLLITGCTDAQDEPGSPTPAPAASPSERAVGNPTDGPADDPALDVALSEPVTDSVYPEVGDPGVDALHYDLTLDWDPASRTLTGREVLTFRATRTAAAVRLDLAPDLEVERVRVDGRTVAHAHTGSDLVVTLPVERDGRYRLRLDYAGTPQPVAAPSTREDVATLGWHTTPAGETWTMQEPYGAHTWYAVNDHPSDKALYDLTVTVPAPWVGVSNGELTSRREVGGLTRTTWHLAEPAASYLLTLATGELERTDATSASGVPLTYWTPVDAPRWRSRVARTAAALDWVEQRLGPYPFDTAGVVVVDAESGMETQTMITLGDTDYTTSMPVLVHELVHHWYGDQVTPTDWRDLWMNEGMAMYLQGVWEAEDAGVPLEQVLAQWAAREPGLRREDGPPGAYDPGSFGGSGVYYGPALMWHEIRERVGDEAFWAMVRAWPATRDNGHATREEYLAWVEEELGTDLDDLTDAWLLGATSPPRD